jgi:hypothetical protein
MAIVKHLLLLGCIGLCNQTLASQAFTDERELVFPDGVPGQAVCMTEHGDYYYFAASDNFESGRLYRVGKDGRNVEVVIDMPQRGIISECPVFTTDGYMWTAFGYSGVYRTNLSSMQTVLAFRTHSMVLEQFSRGRQVYFFEYPEAQYGPSSLYTIAAGEDAREVLHSQDATQITGLAFCGDQSYLMQFGQHTVKTTLHRGNAALGDFSLVYESARGTIGMTIQCPDDKVFWSESEGGLESVKAFDPATGEIASLGAPGESYFFRHFHYFEGRWYGVDLNSSSLLRWSMVSGEDPTVRAPVEGNAFPELAGVDSDNLYYWAYVPNKDRSFLYRTPRF